VLIFISGGAAAGSFANNGAYGEII